MEMKLRTPSGDIISRDPQAEASASLGLADPAAQLDSHQKEQDRLKLTRDYFETGCACIHKAKTLQPCPTKMSDAEAVAFYELNCNCSRNYQHFGRKP